jgi:hypothetical protein
MCSNRLPNEVVGNFLDVSEQHVNLLGKKQIEKIHGAWKDTASDLGLDPGMRDVDVFSRNMFGDVVTHSVKMIGHDASGSFKSYVGKHPDFYDQSSSIHDL